MSIMIAILRQSNLDWRYAEAHMYNTTIVVLPYQTACGTTLCFGYHTHRADSCELPASLERKWYLGSLLQDTKLSQTSVVSAIDSCWQPLRGFLCCRVDDHAAEHNLLVDEQHVIADILGGWSTQGFIIEQMVTIGSAYTRYCCAGYRRISVDENRHYDSCDYT